MMLFLALGSMALGTSTRQPGKDCDRGVIRGRKEGGSQQTREFNQASWQSLVEHVAVLISEGVNIGWVIVSGLESCFLMGLRKECGRHTHFCPCLWSTQGL